MQDLYLLKRLSYNTFVPLRVIILTLKEPTIDPPNIHVNTLVEVRHTTAIMIKLLNKIDITSLLESSIPNDKPKKLSSQ